MTIAFINQVQNLFDWWAKTRRTSPVRVHTSQPPPCFTPRHRHGQRREFMRGSLSVSWLLRVLWSFKNKRITHCCYSSVAFVEVDELNDSRIRTEEQKRRPNIDQHFLWRSSSSTELLICSWSPRLSHSISINARTQDKEANRLK